MAVIHTQHIQTVKVFKDNNNENNNKNYKHERTTAMWPTYRIWSTRTFLYHNSEKPKYLSGVMGIKLKSQEIHWPMMSSQGHWLGVVNQEGILKSKIQIKFKHFNSIFRHTNFWSIKLPYTPPHGSSSAHWPPISQ